MLAELGCDLAQGYLISTPSPEAAARYMQALNMVESGTAAVA